VGRRPAEGRAAVRAGNWLLPPTLELPAGDTAVVGGMAWVSVAQVVVEHALIHALIRQIEAAAVTQHVRTDVRQACGVGSGGNQVVYGLAGQLGVALRDEEPGQIVGALAM